MRLLCGESGFFSKSHLPLPARFDINFYEEIAQADANSNLRHVQRSTNIPTMIKQLEQALKLALSNYGEYVSQLQINNARIVSGRLNLYRASNLSLAFARNLDQIVDADTQLANDVSPSLKLAKELAVRIDMCFLPIVSTMEDGDLSSALNESSALVNDSNILKAYAGNILRDLITITRVESVLTARRSQRRLFAQIFEQPQIYLQSDSADHGSKWLRFKKMLMITSYVRQRLKTKSEKAAKEEILTRSFLNAFWFLQILLAREEDGFPAWEGIRIAREEVLQTAGDS